MTEKLRVKDVGEARDVINLAIYAGQLLLRNGAEIYRAEDTVERICATRANLYEVDVFAFPTAIFVSLEYDYEIITVFKSVETSTINLDRINAINEFSRQFVNNEIPLEKALDELLKIQNKPTYSKFSKIAFSGIFSGFYSLLFHGNIYDFIITFFIGMCLNIIQQFFQKRNITFLAESFFSALFVAGVAELAYFAGLDVSVDKIIIAGIMLLVPGMMVTNALRDIMSGDYLSGLIGVVKAIIISFAIALGIGALMNVHLTWGGQL